MPRRRELRGVAAGLLGSFVSRNNDVGGYWALGKLYTHARASKVQDVSVDLVTKAIDPPDDEFREMIAHFQQMLAEQVTARSLPSDWVKAATIAVTFSGAASNQWPADVFRCRVIITDDAGRAYRAEHDGACWPHASWRERRSGRAGT